MSDKKLEFASDLPLSERGKSDEVSGPETSFSIFGLLFIALS
jgi:hypothetical protein